MSARKAYISSLGTTGLLIAAALAMLVVVGALVAFDRWPSQAVAEAESVPVTRDAVHATRPAGEPRSFARTGPSARSTAISEKRSRAALRQAAARAGGVDATGGPAIHEPIVSDLPAPNSAPAAPAPAAPQHQAAAPAPDPAPQVPARPDPTVPAIAPGSLAPTAEDTLADATTSLGDTVGGLSPALGEAVGGTGTTTAGTIETLLAGS